MKRPRRTVGGISVANELVVKKMNRGGWHWMEVKREMGGKGEVSTSAYFWGRSKKKKWKKNGGAMEDDGGKHDLNCNIFRETKTQSWSVEDVSRWSKLNLKEKCGKHKGTKWKREKKSKRWKRGTVRNRNKNNLKLRNRRVSEIKTTNAAEWQTRDGKLRYTGIQC